MKYLSVCSGIEAATVAWNPLGWEPFAFAEIEAFPSAVLKHRYGSNMPGEKLSLTGVPNLGDINGYKNWPDARIDLLVGGTPCQSFSVAGLRKGLEDPRGNLALTFVGIADRYKPEVVVWENVPGVLSQDGGRAFGSILGALAELRYHIAYRILDAQYVRVDGLGRAVPQRRRRVFVVGYSGNQQHTAEILFERESLQGDTPPCREARKNVVQSLASRARGDGGLGTDFDLAGGVVPAVSMCLNAGSMGRRDAESETLIPVTSRATGGFFDDDLGVAHTLHAEGFDASEDGTGRGTPLVPVAFDTTQITIAANRSNPRPGDPCHPLAAGAHAASHANAGIPPAVTVALRGRGGGGSIELGGEAATALRASQGGGDKPYVLTEMAVRRLLPVECERLQGFPDGYTDVPFRGKPAADGPRYRALGNSVAVNVMRWIGQRINLQHALDV